MFNINDDNISKNILRNLNEGAMSDIAIGIDEIKKLANDEQGRYTCKLQDLDTMKQIAKEYNIDVEDSEDGTSATFKVPGSQPFTVSALETLESEAPVKEEVDPEDITPEELPELTPEERQELQREINADNVRVMSDNANKKKIYVVKESCNSKS